MPPIYFNETNLDMKKINNILKNEGVVIFPTETVYGLGAFISKENALKKIYDLKQRPRNKPFTVHIGDIKQAELVARELPKEFFQLAEHFLPGPLTIIVKKNPNISALVSPFDTIGIRFPAHPLILKLLKHLDEPIVGTSANISSRKNPISAKEAAEPFTENIDCIIDGGLCNIGQPSTIINLVGSIRILRQGFITPKQITSALNVEI